MERLNNSFSKILSSHEGREVLRHVLEQSGVIAMGSYSPDPLAMAYNEGRRSIGLYLWRVIMEIDPKYLQIIVNKTIEEQAQDGRDNTEQYE